MDLNAQFEEAAERVKSLSSKPDNDTLLQLYALYKQGSEGDVTGSRPSRLKLRARAKYDARDEVKGIDQDEAKEKYIALVDELVEADG